MKTPAALVLAAVLSVLAPGHAAAQIVYAASANGSTVGEYRADTGAAVNASFLTSASGVSSPRGLFFLNNTLYVANSSTQLVTAYNAASGTAVTGFSPVKTGTNPNDVLASGTMLYVTTFGTGNNDGKVTAYNALTGAPVSSFTSFTLALPTGLALLGTTLYVANSGSASVGTYNALTGAVMNASFLTGIGQPGFLTLAGTTLYLSSANGVAAYNATTGASLAGFTPINDAANGPAGLAVAGNNLLVANQSNNTVSEYNAATGALVNANFVTGLNLPFGLAVGVPEPGTWALLGVSLAGFGAAVLRRRRPAVPCVVG